MKLNDSKINNKFSFKSSQKLVDSKKRQTYMELILTFVTILFFGVFALKPTFSTIATLLGDITNLEEVNNKLKEKLDSLATAQQVLDKNREQLYFVQEALPDNPNLATFVAQVDRANENSEFVLETIMFGDYEVDPSGKTKAVDSNAEKKGPIGEWNNISFTIEGTGKYDAILDFAKKIANFRRVVVLDSISIDYSDVENENDLPKVTINGTILSKLK